MPYLFDTNIWIRLLKGREPSLLQRWQSALAEEIVVCSIVQGELWHGAYKYSPPEKRRKIIDQWLAPYQSLSFDAWAAGYYAGIRHELELRGEMIGPNDLKIAAICLAHGLTLVTNNVREFQRVEGLKVEDWSTPLSPSGQVKD